MDRDSLVALEHHSLCLTPSPWSTAADLVSAPSAPEQYDDQGGDRPCIILISQLLHFMCSGLPFLLVQWPTDHTVLVYSYHVVF